MRLLVLGGTAWLGRRVAAEAIARGHDVTCLARGSSGGPPEGARHARADRDREGAYDEVARERWDAVVDVARQPGHVRRAVAALAEQARTFVLVSSGNVYADQGSVGDDETAALLPALDGDVMESMESYGEAKVACERHALDAFGAERTTIARVGLIGGPGDTFDRTGYWPLRFARPAVPDGRVLVPDAPEQPTQAIDVRDLAAWLLDCAADGRHGIFNAGGETLPLGEHLAIARRAAGHDGPLVAADPQWLLAQGVGHWMGERTLPLWLPPSLVGLNARDSRAARAAGLATRPLERTLADTLAWELGRERPDPRRAGLSDADERALLAALAAS